MKCPELNTRHVKCWVLISDLVAFLLTWIWFLPRYEQGNENRLRFGRRSQRPTDKKLQQQVLASLFNWLRAQVFSVSGPENSKFKSLQRLSRLHPRWIRAGSVCSISRQLRKQKLILQVVVSYKLRAVFSVKVSMKLNVFHFPFWACWGIFVLRGSRCFRSLSSELIYTCSFFWHINLDWRLKLYAVVLFSHRAGSSQVSVRRERHSLVCDSAVDWGGGGWLLPGPVQTQQSQQGAQGTATVSVYCKYE